MQVSPYSRRCHRIPAFPGVTVFPVFPYSTYSRILEKWLKQMMVAAVDERDADRRPGQPMNGFEPAETRPDHDDMMSVHRPVRPVNDSH